jgi:hypothetical protein
MAAGTFTSWDKPDYETAGGPSILTKIKLGDLPDMNYRITDNPPRGEVYIFS